MKPFNPQTYGFTLVELMVSMVVLGIGIMATMAMQYSSLAGAMISRDNSNAADVGQRVIEIMQAESQQWRNGSVNADQAYDGNTMSALNSSSASFLGLAVGAAPTPTDWEDWTSVFESPVNARLLAEGATRFCVYVRGGAVDIDAQLLIVHVAVVFPSANQIIPQNKCAQIPGTRQDQLDPSIDPEDDNNSLQMLGYRVQFFGTQIARKDYLNSPLVSVRP